jgi:TolA-binding protein
VYFAQGDNDKAQAAFQKVLAAMPTSAAATLGMGKIHFSKNEVDKAIALFEQVVKQNPGTPEADQAAAFLKELKKPVAEAA